MKKIIPFLLIISFSLIGCNNVIDSCLNNNQESDSNSSLSNDLKSYGTFYKLSEAYQLNYLDKNDLLNIAYYYNNENVNDSTFTPSNLIELDKDLENQIKQTYLCELIKEVSKATLDDINISAYYGTYNNCVALVIGDAYHIVDPLIEYNYTLDNVIFNTFIDGGPAGLQIFVKLIILPIKIYI